jgi:D-alanyl-D-alanine carboxypeptidase (penicillin-binding protein 5/6)
MNLGKRSIFLALAALVMALAAPLPGAERKAAGSPATPKSTPAKPKPATKPPRAIPLEPVKPVKPIQPASLARDPYLGAIVVDAADGRVLFEERADEKGYPASVLKLMLLLTAMEQIDAGKLSLQDDVTVSASAVTKEGADLQLKEGEVFKVEDLLYAVMIHSANDAAVALAEKLGGSLAGYLEISNRRAQELGMTNSHFVSANGLGPAVPEDPYDVTTPRDLSLLCREIVKHPAALRYTSTQEKIFSPVDGSRKIKMETHNYILDTVKGCDGLKTGYIRAAGYCIAGTAQRKGQRVIAVLLGAPSEKARNKTAARLIDKGFAVLAAP